MILDCPYLELIGDGFCFDESNNANCNFDGGDCCGYDVKTDFCSDCRCYFNETCVAGTHPLVGDGFCNDETNNALCHYDAGDCCGVTANNELCSNCTCWSKTSSILLVRKVWWTHMLDNYQSVSLGNLGGNFLADLYSDFLG